jgi:hypothetical protein
MQIFVVITACRSLATSRHRSRTATTTPPIETKFRGKKHPEDPEDLEDLEDPEEVQNAVLPSDL